MLTYSSLLLSEKVCQFTCSSQSMSVAIEIGLSENGGNKKAVRTDGMSTKGTFREKASAFFSTLEVDDHGFLRGNTGQILAQWRRPMAYRVALDLPYWTMCSALHWCIIMAIKMT